MADLQTNMLRRLGVGDILKRHSKRFPDKLALIWAPPSGDAIEYTYLELNRLINKLANGLISLGIKKGDGVAIFSFNTYQVQLGLAAAKIGARITPINPLYKGEGITNILKESEAKVLFVEDTFIDSIKGVLPDLSGIRFVYISIRGNKEIPENWLDFEELIRKSSDNDPEVEIDAEDILTLTYTSGTEAYPKGVVLTHLNWYVAAMVNQTESYLGILESDVMLQSLPMFYTGGFGVSFFPLLIGATVVTTYMPDPVRMTEMMGKYGISFVVLPPTLYLRLLEIPIIKEAAKSLRRCVTFGATIPENMVKRWNETAPQIQWVSLYALSESTCCGTAALFRTLDDIPGRELGWVGVPAPCLEMTLLDDNCKEVPRGEVGEIVFRGPVVLKEYFKNKDKTNEAFASGWLHTGDLGQLNEKGELIYVDRKKDMVKSGGENIATAEIEYIISSHPKVGEVAAFGVFHPDWQEALTIAVIPRVGEEITDEEITEFARQKLPRFKVPKYVLIVKDLPRSETGKILKRQLRVIYKDLASERS